MTYNCATEINIGASSDGDSINLFLVNLLLNLVKKFSRSFNDDPKELSSFDLLRAYLNSVIPDANNQHDILNLHLLQQVQQFLASSVFAIIVESFSHNFPLRYLIQLGNSVGQNPISGSWELGVGGIVDIVQIVDNKLDLVFVSDGCCESLKL
jgi:hypothetical protein